MEYFSPTSLYLTVGGGGVGCGGVGRRGVGPGVLGRVGREAVHRVHRVVRARGAVVGLGLGLAQGQGRGQGQEELDKRGKTGVLRERKSRKGCRCYYVPGF